MLEMCLCGGASVTAIRTCPGEAARPRRREMCRTELAQLPCTPAASRCHLSQLQTYEYENENLPLSCH